MKVTFLEIIGSWRDVADSAWTTIHKEAAKRALLQLKKDDSYYL